MNFDDTSPVPAADYRQFQTIIPGIEGLYEVLLAICEQRLANADPILISGAGGGRELAALAGSRRQFRITGADPSRSMLDVAWEHLPSSARERVDLVHGTVENLPPDVTFAAATSILVMHFLPDDGAKLAYLQAIRSRLRTGATYIHADVSIFGDVELKNLGPIITHHGEFMNFPEHVRHVPETFASKGLVCNPPTIVSPARVEALFCEAGFKLLSMPHRCMWFTSWWTEAA